MDNFVFCNPTRILFGKGQISELSAQVPKNLRAMLVYGGGSIKANGVYDQVIRALAGWSPYDRIAGMCLYPYLFRLGSLSPMRQAHRSEGGDSGVFHRTGPKRS
jgi:alcohol dehydrogenase YqhD (iron-dependent ADH family)